MDHALLDMLVEETVHLIISAWQLSDLDHVRHGTFLLHE
jgi:hypothetical protein